LHASENFLPVARIENNYEAGDNILYKWDSWNINWTILPALHHFMDTLFAKVYATAILLNISLKYLGHNMCSRYLIKIRLYIHRFESLNAA
jgi:hypothetical protein